MSLPEPETPLGRAAWSAWTAVRAPLEWAVPFLPAQVLRRMQSARIAAAVEHAYEHVPFYRETMRRLALTPADVRTAAGLRRLPIVERDQLAGDPERFRSRHLPREAMLHRASGGSVGAPVFWHYTATELFSDAVLRERRRFVYMRKVGTARLRMTYIAWPGNDRQPNTGPDFARRSYLSPELRLQRQVLSLLDLPADNVAHINAFRPDVVAGYGSYLESLFVHLLVSGARMHLPKIVVYGSDHMSEPGRRLIEGHFGIPVLSVYGATENPNIAYSCEHDRMHVNADLNALRTVGDDGRDVPPGESGDVLVSTLIGRGSMVLNYRVGDVAAVDPERCTCGRSLPALAALRGRRGSITEDRDGHTLYADDLDRLAASQEEVLRYQVAQRDQGALRIAVVADPAADREAVAARLRGSFAGRLGDDVRVEVSFVEDLPRTPQGKVLPFIRVSADGAAA